MTDVTITTSTIEAKIEKLAGAEKITKAMFGELSRDLLQHVFIDGHNSIGLVNKTMGVLSPVNRKRAAEYFVHFLPWAMIKKPDGSFDRFGEKFDAGAKTEKKYQDCMVFLSNETNTFWTWNKDNGGEKLPDFAESVTRAIKKALNGKGQEHEGAIDKVEIVRAVFDGGLDAHDLLQAMTAIQVAKVEAAKKEAEELQVAA